MKSLKTNSGGISRSPPTSLLKKPELLFPMKINPSSLRHLTAAVAVMLGVSAQTSFAQTTTATTDPVGFITLTVAGGGSVTSPKLSLVSPTVTQPISWQGAIATVTGTGSGVGATTTITVAGTPWTASQFNGAAGNFYVEIVTVLPNTHTTGALAVISATTANSITVAGNLTSPNVFAQVADSIRIRKEMTFNDTLGATNAAGLLSTDDPATADEVLVYDGAASVSYYYYIGDVSNPAGWYNSTSFLPAGNVVIGPHQGMVIKRKAAGALSFTANGAVKTGNTLFPVVNGLNVLGTVSAQGLTLAASGLYTGSATTGVKPSDDPATADELTIYSGANQGNYYYYSGDVSNLAGWYGSVTFLPAGNVVLQPGAAFVLNRKGGPAFNWSLPSPTSF